MPSPSNTEGRKLEIKKYPNRRYYDATHSRHLTLDEIRTLIQQGYDLRVIDARSSADITAQVLTQIILELDTSKLDSLPVPLLVRIIRMNDQLVKDFIDKYFNQALQSFLDYQQQLEEQFRMHHGLPSAFPSVSAWTKAMWQPFASVLGSESPAKPESGTGSSAPPASTPPAELPALIHDLQKQIDELKRKQARRKARRRTGSHKK